MNQSTKNIRAIIAGCIMGIALTSTASAAILAAKTTDGITSFKSTVLVNSSEIRADSLLKTEGNSAIRAQLAAILIGFIPNPLGELVLDGKSLQTKLGSLASNLEMPKSITIRRLGSILKGSDITDRIKEICQHLSDSELNVDLSRVPNNLVLPGNISKWELNSNSNNILGMKLFVLTAETDGGPFRQLIQVKVSKIIEAAQLARLAKPGELISEDMIQPKTIEVKSDQTNIPVTYADAVGKCLGCFKSAGTVLRSSDLSTGNNNLCASQPKASEKNNSAHTSAAISAPAVISASAPARKSAGRENWVVKPGENVDFHFNSGTLSLKIPAKAVQGGNAGDEISLINLQNKRRIRGVITQKGTVEYAQN